MKYYLYPFEKRYIVAHPVANPKTGANGATAETCNKMKVTL